MAVPQYADISEFQPQAIDWAAYRTWASQWDGIARVAMRSSYGNGFTDKHYHAYRAAAVAAGVDVIIHYHYAYPGMNDAQAEADWQRQVVGEIRPNDLIMLDYEESVSQATAEWAYAWLSRQEQSYGGKLPTIYASSSYIKERLQDMRLARYPLTLANWQFSPDERPACPQPWSTYTYLQFTDKATAIPGIAGTVDLNVYLGGKTIEVPSGWSDDGTTLVAPNGHKVVLGFRQWVLENHWWNPSNQPLEEEHHTDLVLLHNPEVGPGQAQLFRDCLLWWTQAHGVVQEPFAGLEIQAAYDKIAALQAQLKEPATISPSTKTDIMASARLINDTTTHLLAQVAQL